MWSAVCLCVHIVFQPFSFQLVLSVASAVSAQRFVYLLSRDTFSLEKSDIFVFPHCTFLAVRSGSSRSVSPCLWLPLVFKLNSSDLHNGSLPVVRSYSQILICGVILGPRPAPTGAGGKNSTHLNETWTWEGISEPCTRGFLSNTSGL